MFAPLTVLAALAIFGVPEFVTVDASPKPNQDQLANSEIESDLPESMQFDALGDGHRYFDGSANKLDQPISTPANSDAAASQLWSDPFQGITPSWKSREFRSSANDSVFPNESTSTAESTKTAKSTADSTSILINNTQPLERLIPITWQSAIDQLNDYGIRRYSFLAGSRQDSFVFECSYSPPTSPRITLKFQAKARTPLQAVTIVLQQIDYRLRTR
jgi:hypothetical protein